MAKKTNCTINGKDYYRIQRKIGEDANGKSITKCFYGAGKKEAEEKYQQFLDDLNNSPNNNRSSSLGAVAKFYTYEVLIVSDLAPGTIELYERQYREILAKSKLATQPVKDISSSDLQRLFNELASKMLDGKQVSVSQSTIRNLGKYMRRLYKYLSLEGYCGDLMANVTIPKLQTKSVTGTVIEEDLDEDEDLKDIQVFTEDEIQKIVSTPNRKIFLYQLAVATGLRLGEILALKYSDFCNGEVRVSKQLNYHYKISPDGTRERVGVIKKPKSKKSIRKVPLPDNIQRALQRHTIEHKKEMLANGYRTEYVFTTDSGMLLNSANFHRAWKRHLKRAGVEYKKFHACRSTYCTILCQRGVPLEAASKLMGHSDINITAEFYRWVGADEMNQAAEKINDLFSAI